jgi:hypothetical protein
MGVIFLTGHIKKLKVTQIFRITVKLFEQITVEKVCEVKMCWFDTKYYN